MPRRAGGTPPPFADRLAALVERRESQIVLGLDPDPARLWPEALSAGDQSKEAAVAAAAAVSAHCEAAIEAAGPACVAVKLQLACFERLGAPGWSALGVAVAAAKGAGLLAIADAKRGDVPVTARAYAQALVGRTPSPFGAVEGLGADAFTVSPLLGRDSLEPLLTAAGEEGAGVFCLVRTSNPGAADLQDADAGGRPLYELLAGLVDELGKAYVGRSGLSGVGAVCGATWPGQLERLRELMPRAIFLLPGVGAQGASIESLAPAFASHPASGLIASSRSIVDAYSERGGDPRDAARAAAEAMRAAAWALAA